MSTLVRFPEFDHYVFSRVLGEGGMGIVFLAEDRRTSLPVAIKVMSRSLQDPELQARFMKETQILASLNHRNIVRCYEIVRAKEGLPSIVMEFLEGVDFSALEGRPFPELTPLMVQAAMGLNYLKERNILHRDLSSNNILVTLVNGRRLVKIVDFGVAKVLQEGAGSELTATGEFLGKLAYASPELLTLSAADFRSDIYSLGVIFFRLLTARRPINVTNSRSYLEWVRAHEDRKPLDWTIAAGNPTIPEPLKDLIRKMLEKEPAARPQAYEEIIDTLVAVQAQADRDGIAPDPAIISTLPIKPGDPAASGSGAPASGSPAPASASGRSAPPSSMDEGVTSAQTSVFGGADPAAANAAPDWLASNDQLGELQQVVAAERNRWERPSADSRSKTDAAARRRAETLRQQREAEEAKRRGRSRLLGATFTVVALSVGGWFAWDGFLRDEIARRRSAFGDGAPVSGPPPVDAPSTTAAAEPVPPVPPRPAPKVAPASSAPSPSSASALSPEGRGLVNSNVAGFLPTTAGTRGTILLVGFRRPANVTGLRRARIVEARDADGRPVAGIEGSDAEMLPPEDPTGTGRIQLQLADTFPPGDPRVKSLVLLEVEIGAARLRARYNRDVLSH